MDMPAPHRNSVLTNCFVDSDHARDKVTPQSLMGILIFINEAPIMVQQAREHGRDDYIQ